MPEQREPAQPDTLDPTTDETAPATEAVDAAEDVATTDTDDVTRTDDGSVPAEAVATDGSALPVPARAAARRRARPDAVLIEARDTARSALVDIAREDQIGEHLGTSVDGERLVTHTFASLLPGYGGWNWFVVLARVPRSRTVTVCEIGLTPGEGALLAPPWVPWADRLRPEDHEDDDAEAAPDADAAAEENAESAADGTDADQPRADRSDAASGVEPAHATDGENADVAPAVATEPDATEALPETAERTPDDTEIVDDDATLLARPENDGGELPGEDDEEPDADLSAEAEDVRTEENTEEAVARATEETTDTSAGEAPQA
ncbi:DUF3027 domain-containing protein [Tersicoccus sp. Bi-70]|uniref:DUF3027 domain-containing protein n=1 Tax=Tersicoccus sp. Bi-70 TaxID=1897634 RepID=UPI00097848D1|nr:DUF3027 domain-containing protein [Tersicoccus sp. Bi-70]OMH31521.1 hypothetical protein BGP79_11160 [Tersicoccus sp. Bi-70]